MRYIKFRAVDEKDGKIYQVNHIDNLNNSDETSYWTNDIDGGYKFYSKKLEQYTGLKDFNGAEIYEGDIVKLYSETHDIFGFEITKQQTGRIYFVDGAFFISGGTGDDPIYAYEDELEVIGNIHENAYLLEGQS